MTSRFAPSFSVFLPGRDAYQLVWDRVMVFTALSHLSFFFEGLYMKKGKAQGSLAKFSRESLQVTTGQDLAGLQEATAAAVKVYFNVQFVSLAFAAALARAFVDLVFVGGIAWFGTVAAPVFPFAMLVGFFAHEWSWVTAAACAAAAGCDLLLRDVAAGTHCAFVGMSTLEGEPCFAFEFVLTVLALAAAFERFCNFVHGTTELWGITSLQGSHFAWSSQSIPRVDVGGSPQASLQQAAAAFNPGLGAIVGYQGAREKGGRSPGSARILDSSKSLSVVWMVARWFVVFLVTWRYKICVQCWSLRTRMLIRIGISCITANRC